MPIYALGLESKFVQKSLERSPVIALETDLASLEEVPGALRGVADFILPGSLDNWTSGVVPQRADGLMVWFSGERLLSGSAANIRCDLRTPGRHCFVPVHFPCLPALDLISVQPRWITAGPPKDYWTAGTRILGNPLPSLLVRSALGVGNQPWRQLVQALLGEQTTPGSGIEALDRLMKDQRTPSVLAALALRNMAVLLIRHNELRKADQILEFGAKTYPGYAELSYVAAILCFRHQKPSKAVALLKQSRPINRALVGSGGEDSYRSGWLMGLLAAAAGNQEMALEHFRMGILSKPAFPPAVDELLKTRCSHSYVREHQWDFCRLVRREPQYLEPVINYLLLHRAFSSARRIVATMPLAQDRKSELFDRVESACSPFRLERDPNSDRHGVMLCGPFLEHSSSARINREIGMSLLESSRFDASLEPSCHSKLLSQVVSRGDRVLKGFLRHPESLDLTIRNQWPPDFCRPSRGKLAVILSWGYSAVPREWIAQIEDNVDELWVPSHFVRDGLVRSGVSAHRVQVIPKGVDPELFSPDGAVTRPHGCRKFVFLFKGQLTQCQGVDKLLVAFREAFDSGDDVTLVISSNSSIPRQMNMVDGPLHAHLNDSTAPHILVLPDQFDDATLAAFYRGTDVFVYPYRTSSFPTAVLEAMACGKPVITTAEGPSRDFCTHETACLVAARESEVTCEPPPVGELVGNLTWFEPDVRELAQAMLDIYQNTGKFDTRARAATRAIRQSHNWSRILPLYHSRIQRLVSDVKPEDASGFGLTIR